MTFFFINSKPHWKHVFYDTILIFQQIFWINRSSRSQMFFKIGLLKNFAIIAGKYLYWGLFFNKFADRKPCSFIKKRLQHRCFHVNIAKFLRTAFFIKYLRWLLLNKVKTNVKSTWFIFLPDWIYYDINSTMTLNSKDSAKLQRYSSRNTNKQKLEQLKHRKTKT